MKTCRTALYNYLAAFLFLLTAMYSAFGKNHDVGQAIIWGCMAVVFCYEGWKSRD
jgi:hypothetical protein